MLTISEEGAKGRESSAAFGYQLVLKGSVFADLIREESQDKRRDCCRHFYRKKRKILLNESGLIIQIFRGRGVSVSFP